MKKRTIRIFISTGEVSGDLQGAWLVEALQRRAEANGMALEILALGGDRMAQSGATLIGHTEGIGAVGLFESLPYIWPTLRLQNRVKQTLKHSPPDLVVLIDYVGPNLGLGHYIHRRYPEIPLVYYIAPQFWVWSSSLQSPTQLVNMTERILAVFPEEARFFQDLGAEVDWVGHPLLDWSQAVPSREQARAALGIEPNQTAVALFPASRRQELQHLLPVLGQAARLIQTQLPQVHFWIPLSQTAFKQPLQKAIKQFNLQATLVNAQSSTVIAAADLAITKSGTVNLEIALLDVPQIVVYRVSAATAWLARRVLKFSAPFVSPVNLVEMKPIVPELLQESATPERIAQEACALLLDPARRRRLLNGYRQMRLALGEPGVCDRAARAILEILSDRTEIR